jgi:holliday junction DNA helicase RuvA
MYAYLEGKLNYKDPAIVVLDVNGIGFQLRISLQTFSALPAPNERTKLYTLLIVREDSHTLFGFSEQEEKALFEDLTSVSGIGPSIAMVMLSSLSSAEIKQAIISEDLKTIQGVKGIGAKTAQRAIIELKDKLKKEAIMGGGFVPSIFTPANSLLKSEALAALVALGLPKNMAEKNLDTILKREGHDLSIEQLIKLALK